MPGTDRYLRMKDTAHRLSVYSMGTDLSNLQVVGGKNLGYMEMDKIGCKKSPTAKKINANQIQMNSRLRKRNPIKSKIKSKEIKLKNEKRWL